jgi:hypothetical protein
MHITQEFMRVLAENAERQRPELPVTGEINKTLAIQYLAPEILKLRILGDTVDEVRQILEKENLSVSLPLLLKTLRPSSLLLGDIDE